MNPASPKFCFIGGSGRSGTTVLRRIFGCHPDVASIPEFRITLDPGGLIDFYNTLSPHWSPWVFDKKIKELKKTLTKARRSNPMAKYYRFGLRKSGVALMGYKLESKYTDIGMEHFCRNYGRLVNQLIENLIEFKFKGSWTGQSFGDKNEIFFSPAFSREQLSGILGSFYQELIQCICATENKTHFVEDNTWNILYWQELLELLPESRLVHIYRDPRDVVASFTQQLWAPDDPVKAAKFYKSLMEKWNTVKSRVQKHTYIEVSLEDLVENPGIILGKIVDFWNLDWNDALLSLDLGKAHSGRWKKDIPENIYPEVEKILTPFLKQYKYED